LLSAPDEPDHSVRLIVLHTTFSSLWEGPSGSQHVLVDGMLNGWLVSATSPGSSVHYRPAGVFAAAAWLSLAAVLTTVILLAVTWVRGLRVRTPRREIRFR